MEITAQSPELRAIIDTVREATERALTRRPLKVWLSIKEVNDLYSIRRTQCFEMIADKLITSKKIGKKVFVSVASLDKYMEEV